MRYWPNILLRGYDSDFLLKPLEDNSDFLQKGLILDFERGNLLRICPDGLIQKASHGTKKLKADEISAIYKSSRWNVTDAYCKDMLCAWNGELAELVRCCLDIFDMPAALAFSRIIDSIDASKGRQEKYTVWPDVLSGLMEMYGRENFDNGKSKYFQELKKNPHNYVQSNSEDMKTWLKNLKKEKKLFLVTGSHVNFANLTASIALGPNWQEYFDIVVCYAKKPGFFTNNRPFLKLDGIEETSPINASEMKLGEIYTQGNFEELKKVLPLKENPQILYIGDNLIQDVFTPSYHAKLETIAIVEEMLVDGDKIDEEYKILHSEFWGNYFHTDGKETLWETIIKNHSKLCISSIESLAKNPIDYDYNEGFYPTNPKLY